MIDDAATSPPPGIATRAITAGRSASGSSLAPPLWSSSTWQSSGLDDTRRRAAGVRAGEFYSRYANPTVRAFEEAVADLEGAEDALAFASGMGAVASCVLALCSAGDHVVAQHQLYAGTTAFLTGPCQRLGIDVTFVDATERGAFAAAVVPGRTMLVIAETPSNPRLDLVDLAELGAITGPYTLVDSTFATPVGQQPLRFGVDLVLHSATKGIAGHNDATLGIIAAERELVDAIWAYAVLHGATPSPHDALNALRGLRTLVVRYRHQSAAAMELACALRSHPAVAAVHYPGLDDHPQHALARAQMDQFPTVLAIELAGGRAAASTVLSSLGLVRPATSLGGPETLVCHPATSTHVGLTPDEQRRAGVGDGLLRISVGLEDPADVAADLRQALDALS